MDTRFWRNKKVLVTGHTGFKGSWLCLWLKMLGAKPVGFSVSIPTQPSLFGSLNFSKEIPTIWGDIRNPDQLKSTLKKYRPSIIIHMAAQSLVRRSYADPVSTYSTNVMGTVNILEAIRTTGGVRALVNVTSDKCYLNHEWTRGYKEDDMLGGRDPYSSSKGAAELVHAAYTHSFFNPKEYGTHRLALASARAGNVIGGGDWAQDRLIPDFIRSVIAGKKLILRNPKAVRPWQHVLEPLSGYLLLAKKLFEYGPMFDGAWNFGPKDEDSKPVQWVVEQVNKRWGGKTGWKIDKSRHPHESSVLRLNCSKSRHELGWSPKTDLATALDWTVDWYMRYAQKKDMFSLSQKQILLFQNLEG